MLSCSIWFSAPSFWMGGGLESRCVGRVNVLDGSVRRTAPSHPGTLTSWNPLDHSRPVTGLLYHLPDGQTDRHVEANSRFSQIRDRDKNITRQLHEMPSSLVRTVTVTYDSAGCTPIKFLG
jgi:hypothetical protein